MESSQQAAEDVLLALRREGVCCECGDVDLLENMSDGACNACYYAYQQQAEYEAQQEEEWREEQNRRARNELCS